jgi:hypothetical protein
MPTNLAALLDLVQKFPPQTAVLVPKPNCELLIEKNLKMA